MTPCNMRPETVPVDHRRVRDDAEPRGITHYSGRMRRRQQRLARDAARVQAVAAHAVPLDQHHGRAKLRRSGGHR